MYSAQCLCGRIKINLSGDPIAAALCHCLDCRRISGSAFGLNWVVKSDDLTVTSGKPSEYVNVAGSGNPVTNHFCGSCGTTMWRDGPATGGMMYMKAGTLDQQSAVDANKPKAEIFTKRRLCWLDPVEEAFQKKEMV